MSLSHFTFSGTSYEQGLAHGETLKDSIKKNIDVYLDRFETEAGRASRNLEVPQNRCPQNISLTER